MALKNAVAASPTLWSVPRHQPFYLPLLLYHQCQCHHSREKEKGKLHFSSITKGSQEPQRPADHTLRTATPVSLSLSDQSPQKAFHSGTCFLSSERAKFLGWSSTTSWLWLLSRAAMGRGDCGVLAGSLGEGQELPCSRCLWMPTSSGPAARVSPAEPCPPPADPPAASDSGLRPVLSWGSSCPRRTQPSFPSATCLHAEGRGGGGGRARGGPPPPSASPLRFPQLSPSRLPQHGSLSKTLGFVPSIPAP